MDDEFKLCWKNFQDNIASGFQNLYDRGDLVDVTLACDGKLLQAHKIVLAICSPYFQEIFTTNPCQHPIIILKDVSFNIMCELLEFMYQGVVNVKHTELQSFMKIGQLLQIKGLATNTNSTPGSSPSEKFTSQAPNASDEATRSLLSSSSNNNNNTSSNVVSKTETDHDHNEVQTSSKASTHSNSRNSNPSPGGGGVIGSNYSSKSADQQLYSGVGKRHAEFSNDSLSIYSRKQRRRSLTEHGSTEHGSENTDASMEALNTEEFFLPPIPHISMAEPRYDLGGVKREGEHHGSIGASSSTQATAAAVASLRNPFGPAFNLDYNFYKASNNNGSIGGNSSAGGSSTGSIGGNNNNGNSGAGAGANVGTEYPNELYMPNDYSKNFGNHMDIPPNGSNMVMLSTTSLLHGSCVFNRNNTVATQQGMKTYWLCKSYRISMCRARCITHLGRIISATGVHNHTPHMRGNSSSSAAGSNAITVTPNPNPNQVGAGNYGVADVHLSGVHIAPPPPTTTVPSGELNHSPSPVSSSASACPRLGAGGSMFATQTPPPSSQAPLSSHHHTPAASVHHHHHLAQTLPNLLVQHHSNALHHSSVEQLGMASSAGPPPNSVIQNIMHNPNLMHLPMQQQHQQQQHSPHTHHAQQQQQQQQHHLELGSALLPVSPAHIQQQQSPQSNRSSHSLHGATESPVCMKSPPPPSAARLETNEQHVLAHNAALSPADINSNTAGSAEATPTAQVIDSITISPGSGHNFKIENM